MTFDDLLFGLVASLYLAAFLGSLYRWYTYLMTNAGSWLLSPMSTRTTEYTAGISKSNIPYSPAAGIFVVLFVLTTLVNVIILTLKSKVINVSSEGVSSNAIIFLSGWSFLMFLQILWLNTSFNIKHNMQQLRPYFSIRNFQESGEYFRRAFSLFCYSVLPVYTLMISTLVLRDQSKLNPMLKVINADTEWSTIAWVYLGAVIAAPLAEELIFRFCLQTLLVRLLKPMFALVLTATLFGAAHGWPDALPLLPLALILGFHMYYTGEYITVALTHALFNAYMLTLFVLVTYMDH